MFNIIREIWILTQIFHPNYKKILIYIQIIIYGFLSVGKSSITYGFYIQIYYIWILYTDLLHTDLLSTGSNPYVITYGSKSVCNYHGFYIRIYYIWILHTNFTYRSKFIYNWLLIF